MDRTTHASINYSKKESKKEKKKNLCYLYSNVSNLGLSKNNPIYLD